MADPPCDDAPRNCVMFAPSLALVGLGHRRDLPGIELVDVVDQIVGESLLRIELLLDDVLWSYQSSTPDSSPRISPHRMTPMLSASRFHDWTRALSSHFVGEGSRLVDPGFLRPTTPPNRLTPLRRAVRGPCAGRGGQSICSHVTAAEMKLTPSRS